MIHGFILKTDIISIQYFGRDPCHFPLYVKTRSKQGICEKRRHIDTAGARWKFHSLPVSSQRIRIYSAQTNMADLEPIGYQLLIITFVFGFVALATLSMRVWFRVRQKKYDASDSCLIVAMVSSRY
jgi:hypothetical protein